MVRVPGLKQMSCHDATILDRLPFQTPLLLGLARDVDCTPWLGPCLAFGWQSRFWASTDDQEQLEIWQCSFFALVCQRVHEMLLSFVEYRPTLENGASEAVMDLLLAEMCDAQETGISKTKQVKRLRLENVDNYRKQLEQNAEIDYNGHVDELQLSKNQMALVAGMFNGGLLTEEDLLDG